MSSSAGAQERTRPAVPITVALARVFRMEYVFATLPGLTITYFLCARGLEGVPWRAVLEGSAIIGLAVFGCLGLNAVTDRRIDQAYQTGKRRIAEAVERVGVRPVRTIIVGLNLVAIGLAFDLGWQRGSWWPVGLTAAMIFFACGYSLPPLQFKLRGVLAHAIALALGTCVLPFFLSAYCYLERVPASLAVFIAGFSTAQYGFEYVNQLLDYLEDRAAGQKTPAVRLGVMGTLRAGLSVPLAGAAIAFAGLWWMFVERAVEASSAPSTGGITMAWLVACMPMVIGYWLPLSRTVRMYHLCRGQLAEACVPRLPALCNYAAWQASSVAGVALSAAVFQFVTCRMWQG